jgi:hypothetical protein
MTDEKRLQLLLEQLRKQQAAQQGNVDTLSQTAMDPEQLAQLAEQAGYDPSGKEAMLATMLRGGQDAVYGDMPQGRMMGDAYAAPSWSESLNGMASKLVGGYQMGQARKEQTGIDEKRGLSKTAAAKVAAEEARIKQLDSAQGDLRALQTDEQKILMERQKAAAAAERFNKQQSAAESRLTRTLAAKGTGTGSSGRGSKNEPVRYIDPYDGAEQMAAFDKSSGTYFDPMTGGQMDPKRMEGKIREDAMTEGQREKAVQTFIDKNKDTFGLMHDIESAQDTWQANGMQPGENPFNWFTKQTGALGDAARVIADSDKKGAPTQDDYAAAQTVINTISRLRAGLSQTTAELERIRTETGQDVLASPDVFMKYWSRLKTKVGNDIAMANKTASPRTIQAYQRWEGQKSASNAPVVGMEDFAAKPDAGGLTPQEAAELEELKKRFGGAPR